jgi:hypothetical protein
MDTFWIYKPKIIFEDYYEIIPNNKMSRTKQLNTITRFIIYLIILTLIFDSNSVLILLCITALIMIIIFYFINKSDIKGVAKDIANESKDEIEKYTQINKSTCNNGACMTYRNLDSKTRDNNMNRSIINIFDKAKNKVTKTTGLEDNKVEVESGYIDGDGNYRIGADYSYVNYKDVKKSDTPTISYDKNKYFADKTCRKPTANNPWANIVFSDYLDAGNLAEPCNVDQDEIKQEMQSLYNSTIYRNVSDVFERENSQRIFYTVPITTIPNKQTEFANWLYRSGPTCKENSNNCTYFEEPYMVSPRY